MNISRYRLDYSEYNRPLIAIIGTLEKDAVSYVEAFLFHEGDGAKAEDQLSLQSAGSKRTAVLSEIAKDRFLEVARGYAKTSSSPVPVVEFQPIRNWEELEAWRSLQLYQSMLSAEKDAKWPELAATIKNIKLITYSTN